MTTKTRPRKKKTIIEEEVPEGQNGFDEPATEFDVSLESVQDTETLNDVLAQFGQQENVLYRIYKQTPNGNSFCYETTEYNVTFLQRERGAGVYTVRIFINGRFKKSITEIVESPSIANPANGAAPSGDPHAQFLEKLLMVLITNQATTAGTTHGPSIIEMTQALANLDGLRGKQESGMDMFKQGMDMARSMLDIAGGGSGDWKTELLRMGREALPGITSIVQSRMQPAVATPSQPEGNQPVMIDPEQMTDDQKKSLLKQTITYLKGQFIAGLPPDSALDFIVANSGNPQYQVIIKAVLAYSFDDLVGLDAELKSEPFHVCFRTVYDGLRSEFGSDDPVDDDPGRDSGDTDDVGSNGSTRTAR
jgi:hypothetical protein